MDDTNTYDKRQLRCILSYKCISPFFIMQIPLAFMEVNGGIVGPDGKGHDIWCLGAVIHHAAMWAMNLRLMLQIKNFTFLVLEY